MDRTYWVKQGIDPAFPELHWSKPENKLHAGKLLIIGGNLHGFNAPAEAYSISTKEGIGVVNVLLPNLIQKQFSKFPKPTIEVSFSQSTPSGSFSVKALPDFIDHSIWADGVLLAGDLGHNSETAILLEKYVLKFPGILMLTKDAVDYFLENPMQIFQRPKTTLVLTIAQLQKIATRLKYRIPFKFNMDVIQLSESLHYLTSDYPICIILKHLNKIYVAYDGKVSTTESLNDDQELWRIPTASKAIVWWIQNPNKVFEALTTSIVNKVDK